MNTEQIIKGLEIHINDDGVCKDCPYECPEDLCMTNVMKDALALIKKLTAKSEVQNKAISNLRRVCATNNLDIYRYEKKIQKQQAEIERLKLEKAGAEAGAMMFVKELQAQMENLQKENTYLRERLVEEAELKEDMESLRTAVGHNDPVGERGECGLKHICMTDTVKKMQEMLKAMFNPDSSYDIRQRIDQVAKEILEGE